MQFYCVLCITDLYFATIPVRFVGVLPMSTHVPARDSSRLKQMAELWPYILIALSILGLALKLYRGTL